MERFLYFSIGCLLMTAIFFHIFIIRSWNKERNSLHKMLYDQSDWIKTLSNQVEDLDSKANSFHRIQDQKLEEIKKLIETIPKSTESTEPKMFRKNNWEGMKRAFCVPGTKVAVDE